MTHPRILYFDIETSPLIGYAWDTYQTNILKIIEHSKVISISWKFSGDKDVSVKCIADYKKYKKGVIDDKELIKDAWKLLDEADVVVGHHCLSFDIKKLNNRFVFHGLNAPSPYQVVDTKQQASRHFKFDSNKLDNLSQYFGIGGKINNGGFSLWERCIAGDVEAWKLMKEYNVQDVVLLEKLYLILRPFIKSHPNLNLLSDNPEAGCVCPSCKSKNVTKRGFSVTRTGRKQRYQCSDCGSWSAGPFQKVKTVLVPSEDSDE